jgi:hypothetical protein
VERLAPKPLASGQRVEGNALHLLPKDGIRPRLSGHLAFCGFAGRRGPRKIPELKIRGLVSE